MARAPQRRVKAAYAVSALDTATAVALNPNAVPEGAVPGTLVGALTSSPAFADFTLIDDAGGRFALDGANLVTGTTPTNFEDAASHQITVRAVRGLNATDVTMTVNVIDVQEIVSITITPNYVIADIAPGDEVATLISTPPGAAFTLTDDADGRFELDGDTINAGPTPLDAADGPQTITVRGEIGGETLDQPIVIDVLSDAVISGISLTNASISEAALAGAPVGTLSSTPPGATFALTDNAAGRFGLAGANLVRGATGLDYETATKHNVTVLATLFAGQPNQSTTSRTFQIDVTNVNEITGLALSNDTVLESAPNGAVIGALTSTPPGASFALVDTLGGRFAIAGNNLVRGATALNFEDAASHTVTIVASLGADTLAQPFTIQVADVVELTNFILTGASIAEDAALNAPIGTFSSTPAGATYSLIDNAGGRFALSGSGLVKGATALDYAVAQSHDITVRAARGGETMDKVFTVSVTEAVPVSAIALSNASVPESIAQNAVVGAFTSTPAGATYVLDDNAGGRFAISGSNLVRGATALDYEAFTSHQITVTATLGQSTHQQSFTINVTNVAEITNITLGADTISENAVLNTVVGGLISTPAGAAWSMVETAGNRFAIAGNNLVRGATPLDYETATTHEVTVRGTRLGETLDKTFTVNVTNVNELTGIAVSNLTASEDAGAGAVIGAISSTPAGASFVLTDNAGGRFAISGTNLVRGATALDYEAFQSHSITIQATLGADTRTQSFTVTVADVDEISDIGLTNASAAENIGQGVAIGTLFSTPAGATWALTNTAGNRFALSGNSLVRGVTALDYETATSHDVTVRGTRLGETFDKTFTISVTNINEITAVTLSNTSVQEDATQFASVGELNSTPAGATFSLTDTAGGRFALSNTILVRGPTPLDYEAASSHNITVRASLGADTFDQPFTINVIDVDEISNITLSNASINEDAAAGAVVGTLASTPAGATWTITNSAGNRFAITGDTLVRGSTALNYDDAQQHTITIRGTRLSETFDKDFVIAVNDVVQFDSIALSNTTMQDNLPQGSPIGTLSSSPAGASFSMVDTASNRFDVSGNSLVAGSKPADINSSPAYNIRVKGVKDGLEREQNFYITLAKYYPDIYLSQSQVLGGLAQGANMTTLYFMPYNMDEVGRRSSAQWTLLNDAGGRFQLSGGVLQQGPTPNNAGETHTIRVQVLFPTASGDKTRTEDIEVGILAGAYRATGGAALGLQGPAGGGSNITLSSGGTGGSTPYSSVWSKEARLPVNFATPNASSTQVTIAAGTPPGLYKGVIRCTTTDNTGAVRFTQFLGVMDVS